MAIQQQCPSKRYTPLSQSPPTLFLTLWPEDLTFFTWLCARHDRVVCNANKLSSARLIFPGNYLLRFTSQIRTSIGYCTPMWKVSLVSSWLPALYCIMVVSPSKCLTSVLAAAETVCQTQPASPRSFPSSPCLNLSYKIEPVLAFILGDFCEAARKMHVSCHRRSSQPAEMTFWMLFGLLAAWLSS